MTSFLYKDAPRIASENRNYNIPSRGKIKPEEDGLKNSRRKQLSTVKNRPFHGFPFMVFLHAIRVRQWRN